MLSDFQELAGSGDVLNAHETLAYLMTFDVETGSTVGVFQRCVLAWMSANKATPRAALDHFAPRYIECWRANCGNTDKSLDAFLAPYRVN